MAASASNDNFTASQAPGSDGVATGLRLDAVDCSSPGNCVAVGSQGGGGAGHLTQVSSKKLIVTCPAHARGTVDVRVTTAGGTSPTHHADEFTYH